MVLCIYNTINWRTQKEIYIYSFIKLKLINRYTRYAKAFFEVRFNLFYINCIYKCIGCNKTNQVIGIEQFARQTR